MKNLAEGQSNPFTLINVVLLIVGLVITGIALHRIAPFSFDKRFWWQTGPLILMLAIAFWLIQQARQSGQFAAAANVTVRITSGMYLMLILLFMVMGVSGIVTRLYQPQIEGLIARSPIVAGLLGGFLIPSPNTVSPMIARLWPNANIRTGVMYFALANSILSITLFQLRVGGFPKGSIIPHEIYATGLAMSIFMIIIVRPAMYVGDWMLKMWNSF